MSELKRMLVILLILWACHMICSSKFIVQASNVHIVYLGEAEHEDPTVVTASHHDMLSNLLGSKDAAQASIVYSYHYAFSGFAARLTQTQAEKIAEFPGIVQVMPNRMHKLHTTRSWDFLGLHPGSPQNLLSRSRKGEEVIDGVIDSGIWPESESFDDTGMRPVPSRWKGTCQHGDLFNSTNCNKKLIGARWFLKGMVNEMKKPINTTNGQEYLSARDADGHGTHTASTAAGQFVHRASYRGLAFGTARGGAPHARLAIYKACWSGCTHPCTDADILKAFDMAVHDGVDVLSVSLGSGVPLSPYVKHDMISIGSFHAVAKGISVVCSGGNDGPFSQTISNTEPWVTTVAAATIDRAFPSAIMLGNNHTFLGHSMNVGGFRGYIGGFHHLKYSMLVAVEGNNTITSADSRSCMPGSLNATLTAGKVILCFSVGKYDNNMFDAAKAVVEAGGIGLIFAQSQDSWLYPCGDIPCIKVDYEVGSQILSYIMRKQRSATVKLIQPKTVIGKWVSPRIAYFSSRGPSSLSPAVLKPDIAAPGVSILAAISRPTDADDAFFFLSGTSMATPHVAAIVALIKSVHPDWSPAAIKSALVTTASQTSSDGGPIIAEDGTRKEANPFDFGGGHVDPNRAMDPGLVYDMSITDYVPFLCSLNYTDSSISKLMRHQTHCQETTSSDQPDLNLPSIVVPNLKGTVTVSRTVTNVGPISSVYRALVQHPHGVKLVVKPEVLSFNSSTERIGFKVTFSSPQRLQEDYTFGSLTWTDGEHFVRIPVAVRAIIFDSYADM